MAKERIHVFSLENQARHDQVLDIFQGELASFLNSTACCTEHAWITLQALADWTKGKISPENLNHCDAQATRLMQRIEEAKRKR